MRRALFATAASLLLLSCGSDPIFKVDDFPYDPPPDSNFVPKDGYVDRAGVAAGIAEAVAIRFYGRNEIEKQRPYLVKRLSDRWIVTGSWLHGKEVNGGVFEIEISAADGKILRLMHGE